LGANHTDFAPEGVLKNTSKDCRLSLVMSFMITVLLLYLLPSRLSLDKKIHNQVIIPVSLFNTVIFPVDVTRNLGLLI
jgi:hypothetical protein